MNINVAEHLTIENVIRMLEQGYSFEVHVSEEKLMFNIWPKAPLTYKATYVLDR